MRVAWFMGALGGVRQQMELSVSNAALADHPVREGAHITARAAQHGDLQALVPVEMDMQSRNREVVVIVLLVGQPAREIARLVVIDIGESREAGRSRISLQFGAGRLAQDVPDRFRTAAITFRRAQGIDECQKLGIDCDRDPFHLVSCSRRILSVAG